MAILKSTDSDIPELVNLLNLAYRGEDSKKGWTTEADLLQGDKRTDAATLKELMNAPEATLLKYVDDQDKIRGTVYLQKQGNKLYLGMLSVAPDMQAMGIGKDLMNAATEYAKKENCQAIFMRVITVRSELIDWYKKKGYKDSGKREPFPTDNRFGIPTQELEFMIMEKEI